MEIQSIEIGRIVEDPDQPRKHIDEESLRGLADSLRQHGVLQPITVTALTNVNMYRIITGERRWRAAGLAGLEVVPCIVKDLDEEDVLTEQLVENMQRQDLQPLEKARALTAVKERLSATNREIGERLGLGERTVSHLLDLLELPEEIGEQVISSPNKPADGQLTEKHARFLRQLNDDPDLQGKVVEKIRDGRLTGEQTGKLVKALRAAPEQSDEIMDSEPGDLLRYAKPRRPDTITQDDAPFDIDPVAPAAPSAPLSVAQHIVDFIATLDTVRPMDLPRPSVRQLQDALTELRMALDALLRECRLELGEP
ncbi:MAG: ParB/RepB/Spo0J family partition protein [Armatimonadetes bacterium]|nr:ParB/RepB/Spo0J family partition protein [Armatimonadota bacterium]